MLDKMGAMGMISVFDVEEIGPQVLVDDIGMSKDLAYTVVEVSSERAKEVAAQREIDAAEAASRAAEDASATDHLLGGAGSYASASAAAPAPDQDAEGRASSILGG